MYNKQKDILIDIDIACGEIIKKNKVTTFETLWNLLPQKFKIRGLKWYVNEKFNDFRGI